MSLLEAWLAARWTLIQVSPLDELDSFMYQTVGHSGLATLAQALDLPFFSRAIKGTAVNVGGEYGTREGKDKVKRTENDGDETEDLYELLKDVKVRKRSPGRCASSAWLMHPCTGSDAVDTRRLCRCDPLELPASARRACVRASLSRSSAFLTSLCFRP